MKRDFQFGPALGMPICILLAAFCCAGCQRWRMPAELAVPLQSESAKPDRAEPESHPADLQRPPEDYAWYQRNPYQNPRISTDSQTAAEFQWRNDFLEELASASNGANRLRAIVQNGDQDASASAAIQLARLEPGTRDVDLERIARSLAQKKKTRRAAIETLARSPQADAPERLHRIADLLRRSLQQGHISLALPTDDDELLSETIAALARQNASLDDYQRLLSPSSPPAACTALLQAAARASQSKTLPAEARACFAHPSAAVRLALLAWVREIGDESAVDEVLKITRGGAADVSFAAIQTLGAIPGVKAAVRLEELSRDRAPRTAGAALAALIARDWRPAVDMVLADSRWQVKRGVAEFLIEPKSPMQWEFVEKFLLDPAPAVQQTLARSIASWSDDAQARASFVALSSPLPLVRQEAWDRLCNLVGDIGEFNSHAKDDVRGGQLAKLRFDRELPARPPKSDLKDEFDAREIREIVREWSGDDRARAALVELKLLALGDRLPAALDLLSVEELRALPQTFWTKAAAGDPRFALAAELRNPDVEPRREAARKLAELHATAPPSKSLLVRLDTLLAPEDDPLVWRRMLGMLAETSGENASLATSLALDALRADAQDVKVRACEIVGAAGASLDDLRLIEPLLDAENLAIRIAAVKAIGGRSDLHGDTLEKLAKLLTDRSGELRIRGALALAKNSDARGTAALVSAAQTGPEIERRLAIECLGDAGDAKQIPLLIGFLDASPTLQQAAVESLEKLASEKVLTEDDKRFLSGTERAARWKAWYQK